MGIGPGRESGDRRLKIEGWRLKIADQALNVERQTSNGRGASKTIFR